MSEPKAIRELRREYRLRRSEILEHPALSWEAKMRKTKELFERYRKRRADLERAKGA